MSCELKTLTTVFILLTISLYLNCRSFSATSERQGYSGGSSRPSSMLLFNFVDESSALESNLSSPNLKRIRRARSKNKNETIPLQSNDSASMHSNNEKTPLRSFHKRAFEVEAGFQGDAPAFGGPEISRKMYQSVSSPQSTDMWLALPMVHCSEEVMTLTASGSEYMHIFVVRANAAPLPLFQVPTYCGYSIRVTWNDLVLIAPYDGCYITKEDGNYVLSLQWWGSPIKISCPMTPVVSQPTPSILCSQFGMVIAIEGAQEAVEKHMVKVNGNVLPLLSETCAYRIYSPPEVVLLHTAFSSECVTVTDGENIVVVILDGKEFTLSCPFPYHLSRFLPYLHPHPFHEPQQPVTPKPDSTKPVVIPQLPNEQPAVPQFHLKPPADAPPEPFIQQHLPLPVDQIPHTHEQMVPQYPVTPPPPYAPKPISCPPYPESFCSQYPIMYHHPPYHQPAMTTASQPTIQPMPWTSLSQPTYNPLVQERPFPQIPVFPLTSTEEPPKMSPSLVCMQNRLMATLPSARMDSIKVKDVNTNTWMSIASVPAACNYVLQSRGGSVELSSPLPSCHTQRKSPTVISLYVRFWDFSQLRLRTLQLQCQYDGDEGTQPTVPPFIYTPAQPSPQFQVVCSSQHMSVKLPPVPTSGLIVQAASGGIKTEATPILKAPSYCGYSVRRGKDGAINVLLPYSSCHMTQKDGQYRIILKYQTPERRTVESFLSCQASFSQECNVAPDQRLVCGSGDLSSLECHDRGCCYCVDTQSCYYPMDECTMDRHFVFSVHSSVADPPFSPATLVTAGNNPCTPDKVTADLALFKIPLDECGVHRYEVGKTVIYMVEILNRVQPISLNYGTITRDSPARLLVECRYLPGSVVSVGYLVKSPSLGPSIKAQGVFGVQLRIAKDEHYDSFYPQYHQPLHVLLGKPLYLEVRLLNPPEPTATLLVHYCVAYPRSAKSAWILIYDGCPNFLDQTPTHKPPPTPAEALTNHVRRFTITTFQFLSEDANLLAEEEIYFMCSTEVCLPSDGPCVEGCFGDPSVKF
ncbi:uncharacterized protein LOC125272016 isoform X2 [Megalobrama amblycephala]|uniref:uncharacterized protein LOC125272016 isoform X2 n=1 Tax=Megalobrama amblycephala TaxID=75352 RepID=UPI0020147460|nr:uncharacterized protein LOC125272016 isoform X2 [Megalobrama amblycephala]